MQLLRLLFLTFILVLGISFAVLNGDMVTVHYYIGVKQLPLSIVILGSFIVGIAIGSMVYLPTIVRLKMEVRRLCRVRD